MIQTYSASVGYPTYNLTTYTELESSFVLTKHIEQNSVYINTVLKPLSEKSISTV